jgi:hypothetical protein
MWLARSLSNQAAAWATSAGAPAFRNGVAAIRAFTPSGRTPSYLTIMDVRMGPGATALTRIPSGPLS